MTPEDSNASPVRRSYSTARRSDAAVQRIFSPPKPPMSFSARTNRTLHSSMSASSSSLYVCFATRSSFRACTLSMTFWSSARFSASCALTSASSASATACASRLGVITFIAASYFTTACTHLHRPTMAPEIFLSFFGSKSGLLMYFCSFLMILGLIELMSNSVSERLNVISPSIFWLVGQ